MIIKKANAQAISFACRNFHYAKSVPAVTHGYNIYNAENEWCGVICFGVGANRNLAKEFGFVAEKSQRKQKTLHVRLILNKLMAFAMSNF